MARVCSVFLATASVKEATTYWSFFCRSCLSLRRSHFVFEGSLVSRASCHIHIVWPPYPVLSPSLPRLRRTYSSCPKRHTGRWRTGRVRFRRWTGDYCEAVSRFVPGTTSHRLILVCGFAGAWSLLAYASELSTSNVLHLFVPNLVLVIVWQVLFRFRMDLEDEDCVALTPWLCRTLLVTSSCSAGSGRCPLSSSCSIFRQCALQCIFLQSL